jgi:hypothetical protein
MAYINTIYVGTLTGRTVILPPFAPLHIGRDEESLFLGDVFDLPALTRSLNLPVIDWKDVKKYDPDSDSNFEDLGCWSTHAVTIERPIYSGMEDRLGIGLRLSCIHTAIIY